MSPKNKTNASDNLPSPTWTQQDDAEYNRLATEMNEDLRFQFTLFTFGITTTTAVLGLIATTIIRADDPSLSGFPFGIFFLVPLVVLLPTSLMILNRARTRNRKACYVMVVLEYKRLRAGGITDQTSLEEVKNLPFLPWETALHIIERSNSDRSARVHLAPAIRYMFSSYFTIEILCIVLAFYTLIRVTQMFPVWLAVILAIVVIPVYFFRIIALLKLTSGDSVQGYAEKWLIYKYNVRNKKPPVYLSEWINKHYKKKPRQSLRI